MFTDRKSLQICTNGIQNRRRTEAATKLTISGNCVICSTLVTATPALSNAEAVPPVETIVNLTLK